MKLAASRFSAAIFALVTLLYCACTTGTSAQTLLYDANSGVNASGVFSTATGGPGQHYMQQISLAGSAPSYTLTSFSVFGVRWNDITLGTQNLYLNFYTGANLSSGAQNALAGATQFAAIGYSLPAPGAAGSYNYTLTIAMPIVTPGATFAVEVTMTNAAATAYSSAIAYRISTGGPPTVGSNTGFVWIDDNADGIFSGSEERNSFNGSTVGNIRMAINGIAAPSAVPESSPLVVAALVWIGLFLAARGFRSARRVGENVAAQT